MTMSKEMFDRTWDERRQAIQRLQFLERHQQGIGREAQLLKRRIDLLDAVIASARVKIG